MPKENNIVYIGRKPVMNYVLAVMTVFNSPDTKMAVLKARGRAISTAIDVAEITRRRFLKNLEVDDIAFDTEEIQKDEGRVDRVSAIEIKLKQK